MPGAEMRILPLLVMLLLQPGWAGAETALPQVAVTAIHPGASGSLGLNRPLYLRLSYRSAVPIRVQAQGSLAGETITESARFNPSPAYPAGDGEALVWIAYRGKTRLDEVRVEVHDSAWRPLLSARLPVAVTWTEDAGVAGPEPAWVGRLGAVQQEAMGPSQGSDGSEGLDLAGLVLIWASPAYLVLQVVLALWLTGRWRLAALAPLVAMLPLAIHSVVELGAGSNLWPLLFIFAAPLASLYLAGLAGARLVGMVRTSRS